MKFDVSWRSKESKRVCDEGMSLPSGSNPIQIKRNGEPNARTCFQAPEIFFGCGGQFVWRLILPPQSQSNKSVLPGSAGSWRCSHEVACQYVDEILSLFWWYDQQTKAFAASTCPRRSRFQLLALNDPPPCANSPLSDTNQNFPTFANWTNFVDDVWNSVMPSPKPGDWWGGQMVGGWPTLSGHR